MSSFTFLIVSLSLLGAPAAEAAFIVAKAVPLPPLSTTDRYEVFVEMDEIATLGAIVVTLTATGPGFSAVDFTGTDFFFDPGGTLDFTIDPPNTVAIFATGPFADVGPAVQLEVLYPGDTVFLGTLVMTQAATNDIIVESTSLGSFGRNQVGQSIVVPEPATLLLVILAGVAAARRRRR